MFLAESVRQLDTMRALLSLLLVGLCTARVAKLKPEPLTDWSQLEARNVYRTPLEGWSKVSEEFDSGSGSVGGTGDGTCGKSSSTTRIVGGDRAEIEEYPWMAALSFSSLGPQLVVWRLAHLRPLGADGRSLHPGRQQRQGQPRQHTVRQPAADRRLQQLDRPRELRRQQAPQRHSPDPAAERCLIQRQDPAGLSAASVRARQ